MMPLAMLLIWSGSALVEFIRIRSMKSVSWANNHEVRCDSFYKKYSDKCVFLILTSIHDLKVLSQSLGFY